MGAWPLVPREGLESAEGASGRGEGPDKEGLALNCQSASCPVAMVAQSLHPPHRQLG